MDVLNKLLDDMPIEMIAAGPCSLKNGQTQVLVGTETDIVGCREAFNKHDADVLFKNGYIASLGNVFEKIACDTCTSCKQIRYPLADFNLDKDTRRTLRRNKQFRIVASEGLPDLVTGDVANPFRRVYEDFYSDRHPNSTIGETLIENYYNLADPNHISGMSAHCVAIYDMTYNLPVAFTINYAAHEASYGLLACYSPGRTLDKKQGFGDFLVSITANYFKEAGFKYFHMGYWAPDNVYKYKDRYGPSELFVDGQWKKHERVKKCALTP